MAKLPAGPFRAQVKRPVSVPKGMLMITSDSFRFGSLGWSDVDWKYEVPYSEITEIDYQSVRGNVRGILKDGKELNFRIQSHGPRKEHAIMGAMEHAQSMIAVDGSSMRPVVKTSLPESDFGGADDDLSSESPTPSSTDPPCTAPGCQNPRTEGDFCVDHTPEEDDSDTAFGAKGCFGCLGAIAAAMLVVWGIGALIGWISGDNDPNREGSSAWCEQNRIPEEDCDSVSRIAEAAGMSPAEWLADVKARMDSTSDGTVKVCRTDLGSKWPLNVNCGVLACEGAGVVTFSYNGIEYAVNGLAEMNGFADIEPIWSAETDPDLVGYLPKKNIGPLLDRGLGLCG
ncbi:MAG: DUF2511 domain-containing protein [Actinomycetota bacterium]|nr:DUF2511 domain-containing protein [Actinomycetota bacterium]